MKKLHDYKQKIRQLVAKFRHDWKKCLIIGGIIIIAAIVVVQLFYTADLMLPFAKVDEISFGSWQKKSVISNLDDKYKNKKIPIYFGTAKEPYISPKPAELGLSVSNTNRINGMSYPWYLRIIPGSILWAHLILDGQSSPDYKRDETTLDKYINEKLGSSCNVKPTDASLKLNGQNFDVVGAASGGACEIKNVHGLLLLVKPTLASNYKINIPVKEILPTINSQAAQIFGTQLKNKLIKGVDLYANNESQNIPFDELAGWIDFSNTDGKLDYSFNEGRASDYLNRQFGSKVAIKSGTTYVSTYNFAETSRVTGANGQALSVSLTLSNIKLFLEGESESAKVATYVVAPNVEYSRSYSPTDTGLSALIQQYAETHPGAYGVSMVELGGSSRRASYNDTKQFTTASTYKLFVAYSTLKRVEEGTWHWDDANIASGRNLETCFEDMIAKSDNACAEALLYKVGQRNLTNEAHSIGCANTTFVSSDTIKTTAGDLVLFLAELRNGQILNQQSSRDRLLDAMSRNIYRKGIPAGLSGISVSDKVGFLDGLLHDAAIAYSPTGTYVLVIMTEGSSWQSIADLAAQIESLRNQ